MTNDLIQVEDLRITAPGPNREPVDIVRDISFRVRQGQVLSLIGESGSGKTSIALALMGYARGSCQIAGGSISVAGYRVDRMDAEERRRLRGKTISYIAQNAGAAFNPATRIMPQVIETALAHWVLPRRQAVEKAISLFTAMGLPDPENIGSRYPKELSGGQLQRLMVAMALITEPEVVIFDEPTTALDVTTQLGVLKTFRRVIADYGLTGIYVTHDLPVAAQIADEALVLRRGGIEDKGPIQDILLAPRHPYTRELVTASSLARRVDTDSASVKEATVPKVTDDRLSALRLIDVTVGYGRVRDGVPATRIVNRISLNVPAGAALGVIGESGCGKSTLARAIVGLQPWSSGRVILQGQEIQGLVARRSREQKRRLQLVSQNADLVLNPALTIGAILERVIVFFHGMDEVSARAEALRLLDLVHLSPTIASLRPGALSGGQKQRINFARALAARPEMIVCDEITAALDPVVAAAILDLLAELRETLSLSCLFITHDLHAMRAICERVVVLLGGKVVEECASADLLVGDHHPYTQLLIHSIPVLKAGWLDDAIRAPLGARRDRPSSGIDGCPFVSRCDVFQGTPCISGPIPEREVAGVVAPSGGAYESSSITRIACCSNTANAWRDFITP